MRETQCGFEHTYQRSARAALLRIVALVAGSELHLGELDVPIAVFIPHKANRSRWQRYRIGSRQNLSPPRLRYAAARR